MKKFLLRIYERIEIFKRHFVTPEKYIPKLFKARMGYLPDLNAPKTYSEKLQWMKLYYHNHLLTTLVDKLEVKRYVSDRIGDQYVIPALGVWENVKDIDWKSLPEQFVLKCTHDSGGIIICKDKSKLDIRAAKRRLRKSMRSNYYFYGFEWPYKDVKPRIIAEKYMEDSKTAELRDYKFFCFDGVAKYLFIASDRQKEGEDVKFDFFDADFNHLPFRQGHENARVIPEKPVCFEQMKVLAGKLSEGLPHVRVDLYEVDGAIYFGEMTFFHFGGWKKFEPEEWDVVFGQELVMPAKMLKKI